MDKQKRILFIDDNSYMRDLYVKLSKKYGYDSSAVECDNIEFALQEVQYDIITMNYGYDSKRAKERLSTIRAIASGTPVVLITGTILPINLRMQYDAYMQKPIHCKDFQKTMKKLSKTTLDNRLELSYI